MENPDIVFKLSDFVIKNLPLEARSQRLANELSKAVDSTYKEIPIAGLVKFNIDDLVLIASFTNNVVVVRLENEN
jgi:hypothetical protein